MSDRNAEHHPDGAGDYQAGHADLRHCRHSEFAGCSFFPRDSLLVLGLVGRSDQPSVQHRSQTPARLSVSG